MPQRMSERPPGASRRPVSWPKYSSTRRLIWDGVFRGGRTSMKRKSWTLKVCLRKETPPLGLLVEYLKGRGATPIIPAEVNEKLLNSWNWVGIEIGYAKGRKPILVTCVRKGGAQAEIFKQDIDGLLNYVEAHRE